MSFIPLPTVHSLFRYTGSGISNGVLQRVLSVEPHEIVCVQESRIPTFAWLGSPEEFLEQFVFVVGPAPSYNRATGHAW